MKHYSVISLFLIISLSAFISCKQPKEVGLEIQPLSDKANTLIDTSVRFSSISQLDTILGTKGTSLNMVGKIYDSNFGFTTAGIVTQIRMNTSTISFTDVELDSMVLLLKSDQTYYGDLNAIHNIKIYEIKEDLSNSNTYYSYNKPNVTEADLIQQVSTSVNEILNYIGDGDSSVLKVKITNQNFINKFINATSTNLSSNDEFIKFFKGLYITVDENLIQIPLVNNDMSGSMIYFKLNGTNSGLRLYCHEKDSTLKKIFFEINSDCPRYNNFNHYSYAHASTTLSKQLFNNDFSQGNINCFLQPMGGITTKINSLNFLNTFTEDKKYLIHKAEIIFQMDEIMQGSKEPPSKLMIIARNSEGSLVYLTDYAEAHFDGNYNATNKLYRFNITRHVQEQIAAKKEIELIVLNGGGTAIYANSLVIKGGNSIKLEVTYSTL